MALGSAAFHLAAQWVESRWQPSREGVSGERIRQSKREHTIVWA